MEGDWRKLRKLEMHLSAGTETKYGDSPTYCPADIYYKRLLKSLTPVKPKRDSTNIALAMGSPH
ncbi:protein of unknown function [Paraburkholderia kururiensis]